MYGTATDFTAYHTARGRDLPDTWDESYINSRLLVASEWIDGEYENLFIGYRTGGALQERAWPRTSAITDTYPTYTFETDEIPLAVQYATYEAAWREAENSGTLNKDFVSSPYKTVSVEEAVEIEYFSNQTVEDVQVTIPIISAILRVLIDDSSQASFSPLSGKAERV